ncbi:MAG: hypothetical protein OQL09_08500 [Gammaproteobacteria bacterium]|nr:hypothetical protein [Gammaproteobacteria bacterium]
MPEQKREFYRVEFPEQESPVLFLNEICYKVLDICEAGIRFEVEDMGSLIRNGRIDAQLRFRDGAMVDSSGNILYQRENSIVIILDQPISLRRVRAEHLYLINKYSEKS